MPSWTPEPLDVDRWADAWRSTGAQWLAAGRGGVPHRLVAQLAGVVDQLGRDGVRSLRGDPVEIALKVVTHRASAMGLAPASGRRSCGGATRILDAADGLIGVTLSRPDDLAAVPAWLGLDGTQVVSSELETWDLVERTVSGRPVEDLLAQGVLLGLPVARLGETPRPAVGPVRARSFGDAPRRTLEGAVVLNLASLWAGPLVARLLGELGARVITLESVERPDGARRADAFFRSLHPEAEFVAVPFRNPEGRRVLAALVDAADVVIEGSRPRALRQLGVDAEDVLGAGDVGTTRSRVWVSITGHGRTGPAGERVGFGDDASVSGGLVALDENGPLFIGDALADPVSALIAAATVVDLVGRGGRWLVDVALARSAAWCASDRSAAGLSDAADADPAPAEHTRSSPIGAGRGARPPRPTGWGDRPPAVRDVSIGRDTANVLGDLGIDVGDIAGDSSRLR